MFNFQPSTFNFQLLFDRLDSGFSVLVAAIERVFFFAVGGIPLIILWIIAGGLFCTWRMGWINIRGFKHAIAVAQGHYDQPQQQSEGEVSTSQALATALSGSVGLGNIAGVAIAIQMGGPGAIFWMTLAGFLGMSCKFVECSLGIKYRTIKPDGTVAGGPMYYLYLGLAELGLPRLGQSLALFFAFFGVGSALGGNMFQANQSFASLAAVIPLVKSYDWVYGIGAAFLVGLVVIGGIGRISIVASKLVPFMVVIYMLACLWVLGVKFMEIPTALQVVVQQAFSSEAVEGGIIGALVQGIRRSVFSNNAGLGVAAIAHSVARTQESIREGIVAILEPFLDTVIICNLTALVIMTTGMYGKPEMRAIGGSELATASFAKVLDWFPYLLVFVMFLFAFATMITWSYYGERCWAYLLGEQSVIVFKGLFLFCIFLGAIVNLGTIVDFNDMVLLAMAVPNLLGCFLLSGKVADDLQVYWEKLNS